MDVRQLTTGGYVALTYPAPLKACVQDAMSSWKSFCQLPQQSKIILSNPEDDDRTRDFGYMRRQDKGPRADNKEMFHLTRRNVIEVRARADAIADRRAVAFIDAIDHLIAAVTPTVKEFAESVESEYDIPNFAADTLAYSNGWTFRFLHYLGGDILAHPHADKGGFTFHLDESDEGGEYLGFDGQWQPLPITGSQTIIFPSMKLQHRSRNKLKGLCHRVTTTEKTRQNGRFAMVAFIDFISSHRFHPQLRGQNFEPGYNYTMPFQELEELYVPMP
jgi:isopenicillin N synthase-like dioxygenase